MAEQSETVNVIFIVTICLNSSQGLAGGGGSLRTLNNVFAVECSSCRVKLSHILAVINKLQCKVSKVNPVLSLSISVTQSRRDSFSC